MNKYYQNKWIMYHEIHKLYRDGLKPSQIASHLEMDARTVKKILSMNEDGYLDYMERLTYRTRKLAQYEKFVKDRLQDYPLATSAQVKDWLMEYHPGLMKLCDKTVYNFVLYVREEHSIPKVFECRDYHMVEELPYGKQAQIDLGEFNMTDVERHRKKVYFLALVMARSRYKYVFFQDHPFTSEELCTAHDLAFDYIGGYTKEVVYDQDKLLLVKENAGEFILTEIFALYHRDKPFKLHFCRKSDPPSKGKIENVIRYVKYNFLRGRIYHDVYVLNGQALEWLERTANAKVHSTTGLVPKQEWFIEKEYLIPMHRLYKPAPAIPIYHVRKDNVIIYKGSYYTLPSGTYRGPNTQVRVEQQNDELIIFGKSSIELARHKLSLVKGTLVRNNNHYRDTSTKITEKISQVARYFSNTEKAIEYLEQIRRNMPRYIRDQIKIIEAQCKQYTRADLDLALNYCTENTITKATDFAMVIKSLTTAPETSAVAKTPSVTKKRHRIIPQKSNISDYKPIFN